MTEHSAKTSYNDDEIDLGVVFRGIKNFFKRILRAIFNVFRFFYNHKYVLLALILLGAVLGYIYEQNVEKNYTNDLLVTPNYGSSDYLYTKIESLDAKFDQNDSLFLKDIFGKPYKLVESIEIKPVVDIYNFVSRSGSNQALFELLFEEEANIEFIENPINSRNFKYHHIFLEVKGEKYHKNLSESLINYVNNNNYFGDLKELNLSNVSFQLEQNKSIIKQIDSIIKFSKTNNSIALGSSDVSFSDNSGLNELLSKKKSLIDQQKELQNTLVNQSEIIKVVDVNYKVFDKENILNKDKKKLFPALLVIIYSIFFLMRFLYRKAKMLTY